MAKTSTRGAGPLPRPPATRNDATSSGTPTPDHVASLLAPYPVIDRFPIVIGSDLSLSTIHSAFRLCTTGIRWQFVDVVNELIEHDPHARGVIRQRVQLVAGSRIEIKPARLPAGDKREDEAKRIADLVSAQIERLPRRAQALSALSWGCVYGMSGAENLWDYRKGDKWPWRIEELQHLHSRRINYPFTASWDVHIWDQGAVQGVGTTLYPTNSIFGLRVKDYPGKFVIHAPQLNGDYPTRDGEARYIATYMAIKRMVVRATAQDFERSIRPWVAGYFNRERDRNSNQSVANKADIDALTAAAKALGLGSLSHAILPDSVKLDLLRQESVRKGEVGEFLQFVNAEISKAVLGQTFTTETGQYGSRSTADVGKQGSLELARYDASCLADSLERDLIYWMVRFNEGEEAADSLCPCVNILVDQAPDPASIADLASKATAMDIPVDVDALGDLLGLPVVAEQDVGKKRRTRMVAAGKGPEPDNADDPNEHPGEPPPEAAAPASPASAKKPKTAPPAPPQTHEQEAAE